MEILFGILLLVMAVILVVMILIQSSKDHRMSGTITGSAETFFGKQKGKQMDALLNKATAVICVLFFLVVIVTYVVITPNTTLNDNTTGITAEELQELIDSGVITVNEDGSYTFNGTVEDEAVEGDVVEGDVVEGDAVEGEIAEDEVVEEDIRNLGVAEDDGENDNEIADQWD